MLVVFRPGADHRDDPASRDRRTIGGSGGRRRTSSTKSDHSQDGSEPADPKVMTGAETVRFFTFSYRWIFS